MSVHTDSPVVHSVTRRAGIAGQLVFVAQVEYPGEPVHRLEFVGSVYGGPVVMVTAGFPRGVFVTDPGRFGEFGENWVRAFFQ